MVSLITTGIIIGFVIPVEDRPIFLNRVGLLLLASAYISAFAALLLPGWPSSRSCMPRKKTSCGRYSSG